MIQFLTSVLEITMSVVAAILQFIFETLPSFFSDGRKTTYDANFISASEVLSRFNRGYCITGTRSLSIKDSFSNLICYGGSGSQKSVTILIPSILKMCGYSSLAIHDPSRELFELTSGALNHYAYQVKSINYAAPEHSEGFNPLARIKTLSDIQKISKMIVYNSLGVSKDPFWNIASENLISLFIRYVVYHAPEEYRTLHNVLHLINVLSYAPEKIDKLIVRSNDSMLISEYKTIVAYDSKMLMGVIATARSALAIFGDPFLAKVTSHDTIDFNEFRKNKVALFINNSVKDMQYYSVISSIFFEQFWGEILSSIPEKDALPIYFLLEEASSLHLKSLPVTISNIRKTKSGILQIYQSYFQLQDIYGYAQAKNIAANCYAKVYMKGQPIEVAAELENVLGKYQYTDDDGIKHTRSLLTADEIRLLDDSLIIIGNKPAIRAKMTPYYEQYRLRKLSKIPPCELQNKLPFDTPPLIPIE